LWQKLIINRQAVAEREVFGRRLGAVAAIGHLPNLLLPFDNLFQDVGERLSDLQQDIWKLYKQKNTDTFSNIFQIYP
jgi:hypothetical protein